MTGRQLDLRLVPLAIGLWAAEAAVTVTAGRASIWWWLASAATAALAGSVVAAAATRRVGRFRRPMLVMVGSGLLAGGALASFRLTALDAAPLPEMTSHNAYVTVEAVIDSPHLLKQEGAGVGFAAPSTRWTARAQLVALAEAGRSWTLRVPVRLSGRISEGQPAGYLVPGTRITSQAVLSEAPPGRPLAAMVSLRGPPAVVSSPPLWQRIAAHVRESMRRASEGLPADAQGLLPGLVVGDESGLSEDLVTDMKTVGMSHLTAVSGSNLAIVTGTVLLIGRTIRLSRRVAGAMAAISMLSFVAVVGPQPSVLRAAVMGGIALLALVTGRARAGISALTASVVVLLLIDPWLSTSPGFALSVAATGGLLAYALRERGLAAPAEVAGAERPWSRNRLRLAARAALGVTLAAQLATAPLVAGLGGGLPWVGIPANLLSAPAVPLATVAGSVAALLATVAPGAGHACAVVAGYPAAWIAQVARAAADVPGGVIPWPSGLPGIALVVVAFAAILQGLRRWRRRTSPARPVALAIAAVLAVAAVFVARPAITGAGPWPPDGWIAVSCDVGQGDATVITTGPGHAIVIDAGPEPALADRCLTELGVRAVDLLIMTHFHADHVEGLPGVLKRRSIGRTVVSPLQEPIGEMRRVTQWLASDGMQARAAEPGEQGRIGPVNYQILWPSRILRGQGSDPNNASVALVIDIGQLRIFLPGDLEPAAQEALISATAPIAADVVKIPHHGSRNQSPRMISWSGARLAIASAGARNLYGHPSPQTLDDWRRGGAAIARTDLDGDVAVVLTADGAPALLTRRPPT